MLAVQAPDGWTLRTVDELKADTRAALAIGPFGSRMKADCYVKHGVPVIRGNNISDTKGLSGGFVYVSEEKANELAACNVREGDLVFPPPWAHRRNGFCHCGFSCEVRNLHEPDETQPQPSP